ncbi:MAG: hypothetical protein KF714_06775 [Parvibaculum sp.]|nr:hypothetical protein [Parvibaculum sp.]
MEGSESYKRIVEAAQKYLQENGHTNSDKSISGVDLATALKMKIESGELQIKISESTIYQYVSKAANDDSSEIVSGGAWRGYWLQEQIAQSQINAEPEEKVSTGQDEELSFKESDLYPLVEFWMSTKYDTSQNVSALKGGGKWGNPDVIGISRIEVLGSVEIEIGSCEVKLSHDSWEMYVFEAVSHKRFSNRSWYCYRTKLHQPPPKGMDVYAERFNVGILQIVLSDDQLAQLKQKGEAFRFVDSVREIIPAPYEPTSLAAKKSFVDRVGFTLKIEKPE